MRDYAKTGADVQRRHASALALIFLLLGFANTTRAGTNLPPWAGVERIGPPVSYYLNMERYRFTKTNQNDSAFFPIPRDAVTQDTYMRCIDASDPASLARKAQRGLNSPRDFLPVLAKYAQTGDRKWGRAIVAMLQDFHGAMKREVATNRWIEQFEFPAAYIPLYRNCLLQEGMLKPGDAWFREMWLYYCRNLHVWNNPAIEWRGSCHRSIPEAISKGLAAKWYPDIPEAGHWRRYSELVFGDFWQEKEIPQNDTGYAMTLLTQLACNGEKWTGDDRIYTDPGMQRIWERLLVEVTPDGAINPYGPNGGWNASSFVTLYALEKVAAKTGDGRYRYAATKIFNYLRYQAGSSDSDSIHVSPTLAALAWLFCDDSVAPVRPFAGSLWNKRIETARLPHTDKQLTERLLGNADPATNRGYVCCSWFHTGKEWPNKLVLRSGWNPGDLFALVELHPTSFSANPGGIMGLNRYGAPCVQEIPSRSGAVENRLLVTDLTGSVKRRYHPDPLRINELWDGRAPDIQSEVTYFRETPEATFARVRVQNMDGLPVVYEREFIFAKNRFLATRETVTFEEGFSARVSPLWNTQNVGPQIGSHWANTFITPVGGDGISSAVNMKSPPVDLLVWFAPRTDCRLQVVDRLVEDSRAVLCPTQLRYVWEGRVERGQKLAFTQVFFPHLPYRAAITTYNPIGQKAAYADELQATAHASGIKVVRDDVEATILRLELEAGRVEWVAFNPDAKLLTVGENQTTEPMVYREDEH